MRQKYAHEPFFRQGEWSTPNLVDRRGTGCPQRVRHSRREVYLTVLDHRSNEFTDRLAPKGSFLTPVQILLLIILRR